MEGNVQVLLGHMQSMEKISIPVYQRNYDWTKKNCQRLFSDLLEIKRENKLAHFFGSVVVKPAGLASQEIVIDGQQRITTISLLILAMCNYLEQNPNEESEYFNSQTLKNSYLITPMLMEGEKYKLRSNPRDYEAYKKLFLDKKFHDANSNLSTNYDYFYSEIERMEISVQELLEVIKRLQVMVLNLNSPADDPQLIFESLNSTGLDLTEGDKIRNFLLMGEVFDRQNFYYENYWRPMEERVQFDITDFLFYYLALKKGNSIKRRFLYDEFKDYYEKKWNDKEEFFEELADFSLAYEQILKPNSEYKDIDALLERFIILDVNVSKAFIMAIIKDFQKERFSSIETVQILTLIETYIARRTIAKIASNALNKILYLMYKDMNKILENNPEAKAIDVVKYIILNKQNTGRIPTNDELIQNLRSNNYYNIQRNFRNYIFERLENFGHKERLPILEGLENQEYSIEHIMPQTLNKEWRESLGEDYQEIHDMYLHNIGNLTLTGYNSKYSNTTFENKQNIEKGFKDSHFKFLNSMPSQTKVWTEKEIKERNSQIIEKALSIWEYPTTDFKPEIQEKELTYFDGEQSYTGYKIKGYTFINDTYKECNTFKELYIDVVRDLYEIDKNIINNLANNDDKYGLNGSFNFNKENDRQYTKIEGDVYIYSSTSNYNKFKNLEKLFELYEIEPESLGLDVYQK